jgi:hypothetical protein
MAESKVVHPPFVPQIPGHVRVFKSRAHTMGYVFESGTNVHFINHLYLTKIPAEIAELTRECEAGHPCFYIDPEQVEMDPVLLDPMEALRSRIREEERAKLLLEGGRDMGETKFDGKLAGIANSSSIRGAAAASNATATSTATATKV